MNSEPDPESLFLEARELDSAARDAFLRQSCAGDASLLTRVEALLADALALDLRRHLNDEPVEAAAPSISYRLTKFARRHRRGLAVAATVALLLVAGLAATGWQAIRATLANRALEEQVAATEHERGRAEANFLLARKAVDDYLVRLAHDPRLNAGGLQTLRRELLEEALTYYQTFLVTGNDDPELRDATFHARFQIAAIQGLIGSKDEALASYREALVLLGGSYPEEQANCHHNIGFLHLDLDQYAKAEPALEKARVLRARLLEADPDNPERMTALAASLNALAIVMTKSYRPEQAVAALEAALALGQRLLETQPEQADVLSSLGARSNSLADAQRLLGEEDASEKSMREAIAYQEKAVQRDPEIPSYRNFLAKHHFNLGLFLASREAAEARALLESALRERERLIAYDPTVTEWQFLLARTCLELGALPSETQEDSADLSMRLIDDDPVNAATHRSNLARSLFYAGHLLSDTHRTPEARKALSRSRDEYERLRADHSNDYDHAEKLARCYNFLGIAFRADGMRAEALEAYGKAITLLGERRAGDSEAEVLLGGIRCNQGHLLGATEAPESALPSYAEAAKILADVLAREPKNSEAATYFFNTVSGKADVLGRTGRFPEAVEACAEAAATGPEHYRASFRLRLAYYAARAGDAARALAEVDALVGTVRFDDSAKRDLASVFAAAAARGNNAPLATDLTERALRQLATCLEEGLYDRAALEAESDFDTLRGEPGYLRLFAEPSP